MARRLVAALLLACAAGPAAGARIAPAASDGDAGGRGAAGAQRRQPLPRRVVRQVVGLVPWPFRAVWSDGSSAVVLPIHSGAQTPQHLHHAAGILAVRFLPQGDRVLTHGADGVCVVWDLWSGAALQRLRHRPEGGVQVFDARSLPDGATIVTLGSDRSAAIWHVGSGELLQRLPLRGVAAHRVARPLLGGARLATGVSGVAGDPAAIWDLAPRGAAPRLLPQLDGATLALEASPCGGAVVTAGDHGLIVWSAATGRAERVLPRRMGAAPQLYVSGGGARLAATVGDSLVVWGDRCRELLRAPHRAAFLGDRLVVLTDAGAYVWDAASCERVLALDGAGFSADHVVASGALVAACGPSGAAVWDARTGRRLRASAGASAGASPCSVAAGPVESMGEALASHV